MSSSGEELTDNVAEQAPNAAPEPEKAEAKPRSLKQKMIMEKRRLNAEKSQKARSANAGEARRAKMLDKQGIPDALRLKTTPYMPEDLLDLSGDTSSDDDIVEIVSKAKEKKVVLPLSEAPKAVAEKHVQKQKEEPQSELERLQQKYLKQKAKIQLLTNLAMRTVEYVPPAPKKRVRRTPEQMAALREKKKEKQEKKETELLNKIADKKIEEMKERVEAGRSNGKAPADEDKDKSYTDLRREKLRKSVLFGR